MPGLGEGLKFKYEPILKQAPLDMKFHYYEEKEDGTKELKINTKGFKLIKSVEELKPYIDLCKDKLVAWDTETTGLTYGEDKIVGFSLSLSDMTGIYVPIRHKVILITEQKVEKKDENGKVIINKNGKAAVKTIKTKEYKDCSENLNPKEALDIMYEILINAKLVIAHNSEFDLNMLKFEGYNVNNIRCFDTLILPYLYDPEGSGMAGLKALEKRLLGRTVPEFKDVLGKNCENFACVKPSDGYVYACHDKETDVLTENGWVKWVDYNEKDKLATINTETGLLEYQVPTKIYKYKYNGKMECCKSQSVDYCVTPNHNMIVAKSQNPNKGWLFKEASNLNVEEVALTAPESIQGTNEDILINGNNYNRKNLTQLTALILADGYCRENKSKHEVHISVSSEKNYNEIVNIIKESPFEWKEYKSTSSDKITDFCCYNKDLHEWIYEYAGHGSLNKKVPREIFKSSKEIILSFLRAYAITDGHQYKTGACRYYSTSIQMINDIQELLLMTGQRSSVYKREPVDKEFNRRKIKKENCHTLYTINTTSAKTIRYKKGNRFQIDYNDYVYCAEVPNHTLITRRNGSTLVSGNCCDTAGLYGVFMKLRPLVKELLGQYKEPLVVDGKPYNVMQSDNRMVKAFVDYYGHAKILIDKQKARQYEQQLEIRQTKVIKSIFDYFGRGPFNLSTSSKEFKEVMSSKHVFTGVQTDKKQPSWSKKAAEEMRRNLVKVKESIQSWKEITFEKNVLSKVGKGFVLSQMLEIYGDEFFEMKSNKKNISFKGKNGEPVDKRYFWLHVKELYEKNIERYNLLQLIQENNSLNKALNSYVDKLTEVDECRMHYRLKGTKSGRLSSGNGSKSDKRKNHYYIDLNAQNLTKPKSGYYSAEECDMNDPDGVLGWKFTPLEKDYAMEHLEDMYIVEGQDPGITIRGCLKAPEGRYVVSLDYDAEELKVQCVISGDSKVKENFMKGIDPHEATAVGIWGAENYDKGKRKKAKAVNFLMAYLGSAPTLADYIDCPVEEAQEIIDKYEQAFPETKIWKMRSIEEMYNNGGVVFSAFGRPRSFKGWLNIISTHMDDYETLEEKMSLEKNSNRVKNAIERRTVNHKIQSTCGDILRVVMLRLYEKYFKDRDPHIDFLSTVHDEINYTIDKEVTVDYVRELEQLMTFDALDKSLPITTSTDIGYTYGNMFPFVWEDEKKLKLIPKRIHHA